MGLLYCQIWGYCEFLQKTAKYFKSYFYVKCQLQSRRFPSLRFKFPPTAETIHRRVGGASKMHSSVSLLSNIATFRNYLTGLDIKSKYSQMSYLMSQLEERKGPEKK